MAIIQCLSTILLIATLSESAEWSYDPAAANGPAHWKDTVPLCGGRTQSPINIVTEDAMPVSFEPFQFHGYRESKRINAITNTGHTARLFFNDDREYAISGGGLPERYQAFQAHFHWGVDDNVGSEHTVNGKQYPLEMHIVHYANERFNDSILDAALSEEHDALAVLGVFYEIDEEDNDELDKITKVLSEITYQDEDHEFDPANDISLYNLLPEDKSRFYRYNGSLTTPDCYEVIAWTVFAEPAKISRRQAQEFRKLMEGPRNDSHLAGNTFRPVQELGSRTVLCSSAISSYLPSLVIVAAMILINLM